MWTHYFLKPFFPFVHTCRFSWSIVQWSSIIGCFFTSLVKSSLLYYIPCIWVIIIWITQQKLVLLHKKDCIFFFYCHNFMIFYSLTSSLLKKRDFLKPQQHSNGMLAAACWSRKAKLSSLRIQWAKKMVWSFKFYWSSKDKCIIYVVIPMKM